MNQTSPRAATSSRRLRFSANVNARALSKTVLGAQEVVVHFEEAALNPGTLPEH
jgi:hypothetical protein